MAPSKLPKCDQCNKSITKRSPGIECSRCGMLVHANAECAGLSNKQLAAIKASGKLEWMCDDCHKTSPRRTSLVIPEEDDLDEEETYETPKSRPKIVPINVQKMTQQITNEIEKTVKKQLKEIESAIEYCSNKVDEYEEEVTAFRTKIKIFEKKNESLENINKHLELKITALEQKINEDQQNRLYNHLEIDGVPYKEDEDPESITKKVAVNLGKNIEDIEQVRRIKGKNDGVILVKLQGKSNASTWVKASKNAQLKISNIIPGLNADKAEAKLIVRHALTTHNKKLLFLARSQLKNTGIYKYIWASAEGKVLVRKDDSSKIKTIRFEEDIRALLS